MFNGRTRRTIVFTLDTDEVYQAELGGLAVFEPGEGPENKLRLENTYTLQRLSRLDLEYPVPTLGWLHQVVHHCVDAGFFKQPHHWGKTRSVPNLALSRV